MPLLGFLMGKHGFDGLKGNGERFVDFCSFHRLVIIQVKSLPQDQLSQNREVAYNRSEDIAISSIFGSSLYVLNWRPEGHFLYCYWQSYPYDPPVVRQCQLNGKCLE